MSPNTPPAFEALPVEVMGSILRQIPSPEDLYSTIRASPRAFASFLCFREEILIGVLQACLPAEIFAEFLGLLHVPKYEDFNYVPTQSELADVGQWSRDWEVCKCRAWPDLVHRFFERHFKNVNLARSTRVQTYSIPQIADKVEVNYLMSTFGLLKRFICDYQCFVRANMTGFGPRLSDLNLSPRRRETLLQTHPDWPPLGMNETFRLQRGFLRFELCCRVNIIADRDAFVLLIDLETGPQFSSLSSFLQRWEEEEIRCVWTYVRKQYQILVRDTVAEFRCDVRRLSSQAQSAHGNEVIVAPDITPGAGRCDLAWWAYKISCCGLPLLQQLLQSGPNDQRRFLKNAMSGRDAMHGGFGFLTDENPLRNQTIQRFTHRPHRSYQDANPIYTNMICRFQTLHNTTWDTQQECKEEMALRERGWVFWEDHTRLECFLGRHMPDNPHARFAMEFGEIESGESYPEDMMYVTMEDYQALSVKYATTYPTAERENFFLDSLRAISDQPSKEILPVFREICSGMP